MFEWFRVQRSPKTVSGDNRAEGARHTFLKREDGKCQIRRFTAGGRRRGTAGWKGREKERQLEWRERVRASLHA